jgi:hypothetical protein
MARLCGSSVIFSQKSNQAKGLGASLPQPPPRAETLKNEELTRKDAEIKEKDAEIARLKKRKSPTEKSDPTKLSPSQLSAITKTVTSGLASVAASAKAGAKAGAKAEVKAEVKHRKTTGQSSAGAKKEKCEPNDNFLQGLVTTAQQDAKASNELMFRLALAAIKQGQGGSSKDQGGKGKGGKGKVGKAKGGKGKGGKGKKRSLPLPPPESSTSESTESDEGDDDDDDDDEGDDDEPLAATVKANEAKQEKGATQKRKRKKV